MADPFSAAIISAIVSFSTSAASAGIARIFAPKPKPIVRGKLEGDLYVQNSAYGQIIPRLYGANPDDNKGGGVVLAGNVIWTSGVRKKSTTQSGGKGPRRPDVEEITYDVDLAVMLGEGPLTITKIWANTELIYNVDDSTDGNPGGDSGVYDDGAGADTDYDQFLPPDPLGAYSTARYNGTATPDGQGVITITSSAGNYTGITIYPGNDAQLADPLIEADVDGRKGAGSTPAYRGRCYVVFEKYNLSKFGGVIPNFTFQVEHQTLKTLDLICADLCRDAGLEESDFDFSTLEGIENRGFVINSRQAPRQALELLGQIHNVDFYEDDGVIRAAILGSTAVAVIPSEDLGVQDGPPQTETEEPPPLIDSTLIDEPQLPYLVEVKFFDVKRDGQSNTQREHRQVVNSEKTESFDLPTTLTPKEARRICQRELYKAWMERNTFSFPLSWKYGYLKPTDVVQVEVGGFTYSVRIKEISGTLPSILRLQGVAQEVTVYNPAGDAGSGDGYDPFPVNVPPPTVATLFNLPFLRPGDTGLGYYAAAAARATGTWASATLWKDLGLGYEQIAEFTQQATMGVAVGALGNFTGTGTDTTNTLTVDLYFGELASATSTDLDSGANLAILGNELIQWETAAQVSGFPRRYTLSNLRRGVKMTNQFIAGHVAGERFALIDSACLFVPTLASEAGIERSYKAVTAGQTVDDAAAFTFTWTGNPNSADTDSGPPNVAKITTAWVAAKRRLPDDKILTTLEIRCPGRFTDAAANMSRVDAAVVSVVDKFGTTVLDSQVVPFSGDGALPSLTHPRKNCEPTGFTPNQPDFEVNLPEATYKVQIRNRFGLSDPIYIKGRTFSLTTPTYLTASADHPQNLIAIPISETSVQLAWTVTSSNPALITWYKIPNDSTPATAYAGDTAGTVTSYTVNNLSPNTNYDFRVDVNQKYSNITAAKTFEGATNAAFPAPTGLTVTENYTNRVRIDWDDVPDPVAFSAIEIYRDSTLLLLDSVNDGYLNFHIDQTVSASATYTYKVRYIYGTNFSDFATVQATTPASTLSPPTIVVSGGIDSGYAGDTRTRLLIKDNTDGNSLGVEIWRNGSLLTTLTDLGTGTDGYYFNDSSLNSNTAYTYKARNKYPGPTYSAYTPDVVITTTNVGSNINTPTTFQVTSSTDTTVSVSWVNPGATPTLWRLYVNGSFRQSVSGGSTTATIGQLVPEKTYSIGLLARYSGDYSHWASLTTTTGTNTSYPAPTSLSATAASTTQINLSWTRNSTTNTATEVWRLNSGTGAFELFTTLGATTTSYSNTGLTANTLYKYKVRHVYAGGVYSNFTAEASATTSTITYPAPTGLTATPASSTQINLAWTRNSTTNTSVQVWRNDSLLTTLSATTTTYNDTNLTPNTQYSYKLRHGYSGGNFSEFTSTVIATTQSSTVFNAPSNLVATATTSTQVDIVWVRNSSTNTGVKLYRNGVLLTTLGAATTSYSDTTVSPSTTYTYKARNAYSGGDSADSNESTVTTPASTSYPAPSGLSATAASPSQINLSWTRNATDNTGVQVWRGLGASPPVYSLITTLSGSTTSYSDTGLNPSTQYTYYVKNVFSGGNASNNSATATATTQAEPTYPPPTSLSATGSPGQVALSWTRNSTTNINVQVWRIETTGANETLLATLGATTTTYTDTAGIVGIFYYYKVRNVYTGPIYSTFAQSGATLFPSPFPAPTNLTASAPDVTGVNLSWTRNTTSNTETRITRSGGGDFPVFILAPTATTYTDTNILPNGSYSYTVQHRYGSDFSAPSNTASVVVPNGPYPPPANFTAQATGGSTVQLAWTRTVTSNTGWEVYRNGVFLISLSAATVSYLDTGLTAQSSYTYKVRATYPSSGLSDFTSEILVTTGPPDFPAPQNLRVTGIASFSVDLAWKRNSSTNTKVQVHRKTGSGGTYSQIADLSPSVTTYTDLTVSASTTYFYKVRHRYSGGDLSDFSNEVSATTLT